VPRDYNLPLLPLIMAASLIAGLALPGSFGSSGVHAQTPRAAPARRQPTAADAPKELPQKKAPRSREDIALERALNNICRGCSPIIRVRNVPRYDIGRTCPAGEGSDRCRKDEQTVRTRLNERWRQFTQRARSDCVQTNEIGGRPSYVQLGICLEATHIAPTLPEGR
jgi:hypothetical protein